MSENQLLDTEYGFLRKLLQEQASVTLPAGKEYVAETRLVPVLTLFDCRSLADLVKRLRKSPTPELLEHVIDALTNHETSWLRDPGLFDALYTGVVPHLVSARQADRSLSVWSAGCSTGQEPYSIGMLLHEQPELRGWTVEIVGTDVSGLAVRRAQEAAYSKLELQRGLPDDWRTRYFEPVGSRWRVRDEIREQVNFRTEHVLGSGPVMQRYDLILLCNVLMYFDDETRHQALNRMRASLKHDGLLILDRAITSTGISSELFETERFGSFEVHRPR